MGDGEKKSLFGGTASLFVSVPSDYFSFAASAFSTAAKSGKRRQTTLSPPPRDFADRRLPCDPSSGGKCLVKYAPRSSLMREKSRFPPGPRRAEARSIRGKMTDSRVGGGMPEREGENWTRRTERRFLRSRRERESLMKKGSSWNGERFGKFGPEVQSDRGGGRDCISHSLRSILRRP